MSTNTSASIDWDVLLEDIADGNFIPVIGNEVYKFKIDDKFFKLDDYLSQKLLQEYNLVSDSPKNLAETIFYIEKEKDANIRDILKKLRDFVDSIQVDFPLLNEFISIDQIFFYLNTTVYNSILESRIKEIRKQEIISSNYSIRSTFPDCESIDDLKEPFVFNVFGSFKSADPALGEEEILEFITTFKERMHDNAPQILNALKNKSLLFLGCTHTDWLVRFFLRNLSNERVNDWQNRRSQIIMVNDEYTNREKQYAFFKNYNAITYNGNSEDFIHELLGKWEKRNPSTEKKKVVFLSYSHNDVAAVESMKKAIETIQNVTCWFDKREIAPGDDFKIEIAKNIKDADLFIPLISKNSLERSDAYVQIEWFTADNVNTFRKIEGRKEKYLMPVFIDDTNSYDKVPKYFSELSIGKVPDGNPDQEFLNQVKQTLNLA